jgi:hypothetical protein
MGVSDIGDWAVSGLQRSEWGESLGSKHERQPHGATTWAGASEAAAGFFFQ